MKYLLSLSFFIFLFTVHKVFSQQNNQWIFGNHAGVDFNSGYASPFYNSMINVLEGSSSVCDANGNLLFYTDGLSIWDKNDQVMPNGSGLGGGSSSTTVTVLQKLGNCSQYYVFTTQDHLQAGDFYYSLIDMCLNNGNGDVVSGSKKILLHTNCSEKICLIPNTNGTDFWLVTHELGNNNFVVYQVTSSGINATPSVYSIGTALGSTCQAGYLKANPSGTKIAVATFWVNICEVVNFNPATGEVSNPSVNFGPLIYSGINGLWYGLEFSPNGNFLYATRAGYSGYSADLYQLNLSDSNYTLLSSAIPPVNYYYGALRLAPDGKIYLAKNTSSYLGVIDFPDSSGNACGYNDSGLLLSALSYSELGLPTALTTSSSEQLFLLGNDTSLCSSYTINLPSVCDMSFLWQDGSTDPSFTITASGTYWVQQSSALCGNVTDTIVVITGLPGEITGDTTLCAGDSTILTASAAANYLWSTGATTQSVNVSPVTTTQYWVLRIDSGCTDSIAVTVYISIPQKLSLYFLNDTVCVDDPSFLLTGGNPPGGNYSGAGVNNNTFYPAIAGIGSHTINYSYSDSNGCSGEISNDIFVDACTGVGSLYPMPEVIVFPTPFSNELFITSTEIGKHFYVSLLNEIGKECLNRDFAGIAANSTVRISCDHLPSGIYYLLIRDLNTTVVKKVAKL